MDLPILQRALTLDSESPVDLEKRTVRMTFSSTEPIPRLVEGKVYFERLSHDESAIDTTRLKNRSVPFLDNHDWKRIAGKVMEYSIDGERGHAVVKMSRNALGTELLNDIADGVRTEVSFGYRVLQMQKTGERDGKDLMTVTKWQPYELSSVGVPADPSVGVGRDESPEQTFPVEVIEEADAVPPDEGLDFDAPEFAEALDTRADTTTKKKNPRSKYGNVTYADPANNSYPIDTKAHAKAAWSYINMPKNAAKYSSAKLAAVKAKIRAACKRFGIDISDKRELEFDLGTPGEGWFEGEGVTNSPGVVIEEEKDMSEQVKVISETPEQIRAKELERIREITAVGARFAASKEAEDFIRDGKSLADFNAYVLAEKVNQAPVVRAADPFVGTTPKERKSYSLAKAILEGHEHLTGFEREMSDEITKVAGRAPSGMYIPEFSLMPSSAVRAGDLSATGGPATGGALVPLIVDSTLIPYLRVKMVTGRMGCTIMTGLTGNFAMPRMTSAATAQWNAENASITRSGQTFDQVIFQPQRLSASTAFSKWLLAQAVLDVNTVVNQDLLQVIAIANDNAALYGTGLSNMPVGAFNVAADTVYPSAYTKTSPSVTFSPSGCPTWVDVVAFEGSIEKNNIDLDNSSCGYVTSPAVKSCWKTLAKTDNRIASPTFMQFIWEDGTIPQAGGAQGPEGKVNGYRALATNQISDDRVIFGKWSDLVIAQWAGIDVVTDPYTLADTFQIRVVINLMTDIDARYWPSFCYSTNDGLCKP
jgi:HK97 family phage major capsid protein